MKCVCVTYIEYLFAHDHESDFEFFYKFLKVSLFQEIDEAASWWSQHNAKKLIDTSGKGGLRGTIPQNFPYFHVEFGLHKGFVHVIDDETQFKSSFGRDVIRGMLNLPEEDMHRRRRYDSVAVQREAAKSFVRDWEPFDWTKQLHS
jgi:hypothetical protein